MSLGSPAPLETALEGCPDVRLGELVELYAYWWAAASTQAGAIHPNGLEDLTYHPVVQSVMERLMIAGVERHNHADLPTAVNDPLYLAKRDPVHEHLAPQLLVCLPDPMVSTVVNTGPLEL